MKGVLREAAALEDVCAPDDEPHAHGEKQNKERKDSCFRDDSRCATRQICFFDPKRYLSHDARTHTHSTYTSSKNSEWWSPRVSAYFQATAAMFMRERLYQRSIGQTLTREKTRASTFSRLPGVKKLT